MAEETSNAAKTAPLGVITSVGASAVFGLFFLLSLLFSIQDFDATVDSEVGQPVLQIFVDVFGKTGATVGFSLIILCVTLCGTFSITSNSRMYYAFSRDGALPKFFDVVDKRSSVPVRTGTFLSSSSPSHSLLTLLSPQCGLQCFWRSSSHCPRSALLSPSQLSRRLRLS